MSEPNRRAHALEAASGLFLRYGYRKTSLDEVARAAGVSRQALYLWYPSKKALFAATVDAMMARITASVHAALAGDDDVVARIVDAFDAFTGALVVSGVNAAAMDELLEASLRIVGDQVNAFEQDFLSRLARELEPYADERLSPMDLAQVLHAVSAGLKYRVDDRAAYREGMRVAAHVVTRPGA